MKIFTAIHHNSKCLKCGVVEKEMIKVGSMVFCQKHFEEIFGNKEIDSESETYNYWKNLFIEKINKENF